MSSTYTQFIRFIFKELDIPKKNIILIAMIAGISTGFLLGVINLAAEQVANHQLESRLFILYLLGLVLMVYGERYSKILAISGVEKALQKIRMRIIYKLCDCELRDIEEFDGAAYYPLLQGVNYVSDAIIVVVDIFRETLLLMVTIFYIFWLSPPTFVGIAICLAIAIPIGISYIHKTDQDLQEMEIHEEQFSDRFSAVLTGFKGLKADQQEKQALLVHLEDLATKSRKLRTSANRRLINEGILSQSTTYAMICIAVFIIPQFMPETSATVHKITASILFLMGPAEMLIAGIASMTKTTRMVGNLHELELSLEKIKQDDKSDGKLEAMTDFKSLRCDGLMFDYQNKNNGEILFQAGPFDLSMKKGEILFITGSNGSGKSTFLKLLSGLYHPSQGQLQVDGVPLSIDDYAAYRQLFCFVFTDFYLFDQFYGTETCDEEVHHWLKKLKLHEKTTYENGRFTRIDLSPRQRKRLALIAAILKKRPICIFDELTADQDLEFRQQFYTQFLPELKAEGRTVIAVTHDEAYFDCCDRLIRLENGQVVSDSSINKQ